ncbi:phosphatidylinositol 4-kinase gamma 4-like [Panicum miliaceum]|uniref:1-phosphatidylinositol 4-kinase n=1 Tax=Panicum miliaceum TaxID=4540 RepID=A0A3L6RV55_PANMI|nr:phosphatidylinositol 4-kinase gamma 4-like [Panicum miliaceum]
MSAAGVATLSPLEDQLALVPQCLFGEQQLDSILIFLAVPGKPLLPMRVLDSESVASVKLRIQRFRGFVVTKQRLVFGGHELTRNSSRVRDYGLADGNVLHLFVRLADLHAITIETANGKKFKFQEESGRNVGYLKNKIAAETGEEIESLKDQRLVLGDEELEDHQLITDIVNKDDVVIHMFIREPAKVRTENIDKETVVRVVTPEDEGNIHIDAALNNIELANHGHAPVEPIIVNRNVKLSPAIMDMIGTTIAGMENGYLPVMSAEGSGGVYFMKDQSGESNIAVFKPIDEEPMAENNPRGLPLSVDDEGLKRGTRVGEGALREVAAYLLDYPFDGCRSHDGTGFSGVPPTALVRSFHLGKELKIGSLKMFVENQGSCEDMGPQAFSVKEDTFPEKFEDCTFEWLYWPQAREPFSTETLAYIKSLDAGKDICLLKFHGWELSSQCFRVLHVSTMLLKKGAERGLTPYDIGSIMCRETVNKESEIEGLIEEAEDSVLPETSEETFLETVSEIMDRRLDNML